MEFEMYRDKKIKKEWRWRLRADNGQIIATPGEGYVKRSSCEHGIELVKQCANAPVKVLED